MRESIEKYVGELEKYKVFREEFEIGRNNIHDIEKKLMELMWLLSELIKKYTLRSGITSREKFQFNDILYKEVKDKKVEELHHIISDYNYKYPFESSDPYSIERR